MANCLKCNAPIKGFSLYSPFCSGVCRKEYKVEQQIQLDQNNLLSKNNQAQEELREQLEDLEWAVNNRSDNDDFLEEQIEKENAEKQYWSRTCPQCFDQTRRNQKCCEFCEFEFEDFQDELNKLKQENLLISEFNLEPLKAKEKRIQFESLAATEGISFEDYVKKHQSGIKASTFDPLFVEAAKLIVENQSGSSSLIQRKLNLGYYRAGQLIEELESIGVIGPFIGATHREVIIKDLKELQELLKTKGLSN